MCRRLLAPMWRPHLAKRPPPPPNSKRVLETVPVPDSCASGQVTESPALLFCSKININYTRTGVAASGGRNEGANVSTTEPSDAPTVEHSDIEPDAMDSNDFDCRNDDSGGGGVSADAGDESMGPWKPRANKFGGLPHLSYSKTLC